MNYGQFYLLLRPVLNIRGGSMLFSQEGIASQVNLSIQQIYNAYDWAFVFNTIELTITGGQAELPGRVKRGIQMILKEDLIKYEDYLEGEERCTLTPARSLLDYNDETFLVDGTKVYAKKDGVYYFSYFKAYDFLNFFGDSSLSIPLPSEFIPALNYLVLASIDSIYTQQEINQTLSNFNKYQNEIEILKQAQIPVGISFTGRKMY